MKHNRKKQVRCWNCNKLGHLRKDCKEQPSEGSTAAAHHTSMVGDSPSNYVDTACSVHIVAPLKLLSDPEALMEEYPMMTVNGTKIRLTHKVRRIIQTADGLLSLTDVFYGEGLDFNIICVPQLTKKGVIAFFYPGNAYLRKGNTTIKLVKYNGLWTLSTPKEPKEQLVASLEASENKPSMGYKWHIRLGHPSLEQHERMIRQGTIPAIPKVYYPKQCPT